jgi:predicted aspartyl protease
MAQTAVQVGDILLTNVEGKVLDAGVQQLPFVLIGMSFLRQVEMRRSGDTMTLQRAHY